MAKTWSNLVKRLHNDVISERMVMIKKLVWSDLEKLTPIQRKLLTDVCSFIATVYDKAYTHDHLDMMILQDKVLKITAMHTPWVDLDFDKLSDPSSRDYELLNRFPEEFNKHSLMNGLENTLTLEKAYRIVEYLESEDFKTLLIDILNVEN
jgi:hypothetical protein